jgi:hypothetical protein
MERWIEPPDVPTARAVMAIVDPVERADAAHRALQQLSECRAWFVRARGEAIAAAYAKGTPYVRLGTSWGVSGERVRQMMFQIDKKRSGWCVAQDVSPRGSTPTPLPFGVVHAMRAYGNHAACGFEPVNNLGADFTGTVYPTCDGCRDIVRADLATKEDQIA